MLDPRTFIMTFFRGAAIQKKLRLFRIFIYQAKKKAAEEAIPDDYLANSSLIGPESFVKERIQALKESGVTSLNVNLMGQEKAERVAQLEKLRNLVDSM